MTSIDRATKVTPMTGIGWPSSRCTLDRSSKIAVISRLAAAYAVRSTCSPHGLPSTRHAAVANPLATRKPVTGSHTSVSRRPCPNVTVRRQRLAQLIQQALDLVSAPTMRRLPISQSGRGTLAHRTDHPAA